MKRVIACCIAVQLFLPGLCLAGSYSDTEITHRMTWKPDGCSMPAPPPMPEISDTKTYNTAVKVYNAYVKMVDEYNACVNQEANRDNKTVIEAINRGLSDAYRDGQETLKKLRRHLDIHHPNNKSL